MDTSLTQDIKRLFLHANFEKACTSPYAQTGIAHLCTLIRAADKEFFSNNGAFDIFYGDEWTTYSDFDLMVQMLKDLHIQTLFEDNTIGFFNRLNYYGIPSLPDEDNRGASIDLLLDALLSYWSSPDDYQSKDNFFELSTVSQTASEHAGAI